MCGARPMHYECDVDVESRYRVADCDVDVAIQFVVDVTFDYDVDVVEWEMTGKEMRQKTEMDSMLLNSVPARTWTWAWMWMETAASLVVCWVSGGTYVACGFEIVALEFAVHGALWRPAAVAHCHVCVVMAMTMLLISPSPAVRQEQPDISRAFWRAFYFVVGDSEKAYGS